MSVRAHEKSLELIYEVLPEIPNIVQGDPTRLRQIVLNLVGNAVKFTTAGEILLRVEVLDRSAEGLTLHFAVQDTGIGIPEEKQKFVFERFTQADNSMSRKFSGTGLGLTISSLLVESMGGRIWVESQHGIGSTFHFTARFLSGEVASPVTERDLQPLSGLSALVVDDNGSSRRILGETLSAWKMNAVLLGRASEALWEAQRAASQRRAFAVVILDAEMPGMNGFEVVDQLRKNPDVCDTPIIMLTAFGVGGAAAKCRESGIPACLAKPVKQSDLHDALLRLLRPQNLAPETSQAETARAVPASSAPSLTTPLAEDNAVNQALAVRLLQKRGHKVVIAETGRAVLGAIGKQSFDLVFMEIQMPEMDGLEATRAIRKIETLSGAHHPIFAMTANAMVGDKELCMEAGMDRYLTKPLSTKELFAAIEALPPAVQPVSS